MFLSEDDLYQLILEERLSSLIEDDATIIPTAIRTAQSIVEDYLSAKYDMATAFASEGEERNPSLVLYMSDIALYTILSRSNPKNVSKLREDRYNNAIDWLKDANRGKITPALPRLEEGLPSLGIQSGTQPKQNNTW
jgi:phage gp36-like protein